MSKISPPDYIQDVIDFIKKKGIDARKERRGWIRFTRSGSLLYLTSSKEHTSIKLGNYGWYDLNKSIYDELVNESELKKYCAVLLGNPETIFVLSQLDIQKIFDEKFMNKPDEWMFNILKEGNDYVLKFIKNVSPSYPLIDLLNRWDKIEGFISNDQIITSETYHTKLVEENISTDTICK